MTYTGFSNIANNAGYQNWLGQVAVKKLFLSVAQSQIFLTSASHRTDLQLSILFIPWTAVVLSVKILICVSFKSLHKLFKPKYAAFNSNTLIWQLRSSNEKTPLADMLFEIASQPIKHASVFKTNSQFPLEIKLKALAIFFYHYTISSFKVEDFLEWIINPNDSSKLTECEIFCSHFT